MRGPRSPRTFKVVRQLSPRQEKPIAIVVTAARGGLGLGAPSICWHPTYAGSVEVERNYTGTATNTPMSANIATADREIKSAQGANKASVGRCTKAE